MERWKWARVIQLRQVLQGEKKMVLGQETREEEGVYNFSRWLENASLRR
jgi:hypothetical protein